MGVTPLILGDDGVKFAWEPVMMTMIKHNKILKVYN